MVRLACPEWLLQNCQRNSGIRVASLRESICISLATDVTMVLGSSQLPWLRFIGASIVLSLIVVPILEPSAFSLPVIVLLGSPAMGRERLYLRLGINLVSSVSRRGRPTFCAGLSKFVIVTGKLLD